MLAAFSRSLEGKPIDLARTYTTEYVNAARSGGAVAMPRRRSPAAAPAIELTGVTRRFMAPTGRSFTALRDFNMIVRHGEFVAIVGPTGCGKSTHAEPDHRAAEAERGRGARDGQAGPSGIDPRIGFVFQADALFPWRSVLDNVAAGPLFRGTPKEQALRRRRGSGRRVGLGRFEKHYPHQLSGGMRKRVALAQTFINKPEILLMDEPFSALDMQTRTVMQDELLELWSAATRRWCSSRTISRRRSRWPTGCSC